MMTLVETVTVGSGGAASITLTSIPQSGVDLLLKFSVRYTTTNTNIGVNINGSTSTFAAKVLYGYGYGVSNSYITSNYILQDSAVPSDFTANTFGSGEIYIPNYTLSANKSMSIETVQENNASLSYQNLIAGSWSTASAITSISLLGNFAQHSTASLYIIS